MADTPRFSVYGDQILDTSTGKALTPNEFNQRSTPQERDAIARELTARSQMVNQESEQQIDEAAIEETLTPGADPAPNGSMSTRPPEAAGPPLTSTQAEPTSPEPVPARPAGIPPSLEEFLAAAKPENPQFDDREIAIEYRKLYPDANKFYPPPPMDAWVAKAKETNPGFEEAELKSYYTDIYGKPDEPLGFGGTLLEGAKSAGRSLKAFGQAALGYNEEAAQTAKDQLGAPKDPALAQLLETIATRKAELGPDASWWEVGKSVGKSMWENPKGAGLLMTEQLPNSAVALGSAATGAAIGAASPVPGGAVIGGLLGLFGANVGLETGQKVIEKAADGSLTPEERSQALSEGAKKGAVVSAVDAATFGMTKWLTGTANRAMEAATARVLTEEGIDVADRAAVQAASKNPAIRQKVAEAQDRAKAAVNTLGQRAARVGAEAGLETLGEGVGEYLGEVAATGQGDKTEAIIEALAGFGQSAAEVGVASALSRKESPSVGAPAPPVEPPTSPAETVAPILAAESVDQAIGEATKLVETPPISAQQLDQVIGATPSVAASYTDSHLHADQAAFERLMTASGIPLDRSAEGVPTADGAPLKVIDPRTLPATTAPDAGISQEKLDALSVVAQAFGKRIVVFQAGGTLPNGAFWQKQDPSRIYLASETTNEDANRVLMHEAMHTMQGTAFYEAYKQTIVRNLNPSALAVARARHDSTGRTLTEAQLVEEMGADIGSDQMQKPEMWEKVFQVLRDKVGDEQAKVEVVGFIDSLKQIIQRIKSMISTRQITASDGKTLTELYVSNLEKVQEALAEAVGNTLYNKKYATPEQAKAVGKLALSKKAMTDRTLLPKDVSETFSTVASLQREKPEAAMLAVQKATGGGLLSHAVEHTGDLIHRMSEGAKYGTSGKEYVKEKVDRVLTSLTHAYGFEKEHAENLANNRADRQAVDAALKQYAAEHKALPVYNRAQWLARAAAVAVGEMRIKDAVAHLKALKQMVDSADFSKEAFAFRRGADQKIQPYLQPVPGKLIGRQILNSKKIPDFDLYDLDVDLPGHPAGSTVTQETMAEEGYRIVPSDLITGDEKTRPTLSPQVDLRESPEERRTLSTTVPRSKRSSNDAYTQHWVIGTEDIRASKSHLNALVAAIKSYSMMSGKGGKEATLAEFKQKAVDNLLWLYDLVPAPIRDRAKRWYDGANRIATEWSAQDGYTDKQHAGVLAVLSPQKDWFMNVSLADRVRTIMKERTASPWSPAMSAWASEMRASATTDDTIAIADKFVDASIRLEGITLDSMSDADAALFIRAYDQTYHDRAYRAVTPEGEFTDYVVNKREVERDLFGDIPGVRGVAAWGSQGTIEKAVSILRDGSNKNITEKLGNEHKVRNFYNNIIDPQSTEGHVTIDTHAMAAAVMKAISGNAKEVTDLFGRAGSNAETGASGSYGLVADIYREAARQRNVLPRELQSVTWEAVRGLFPREQKKTLGPKVEAVWAQVKKGALTADQARARILEISGGVSPFAWEKYDIGLSPAEGGRSFDRKPSGTAVVNIGLNVNDGSTITAQTALSALKLAGASVLSHQVRESNTEPTLIAELAEPLSPEKATALSATLKQDAIAQRLADGTGALYGPAADKWGPFNPEYFLEPEAGPRLAPAPSIEKLARALPTTTVPSKTKFLLPDGRRLTWPESKVDNNAHYELARHAGVWLDDVIREGAIRYVPFFGIDVGKVLTTKQAETIVDDWYAYQDTLQVDVKDNLGSVVVSHDFDVLGQEITPSFLQDWVKFNLEKGDTPRFNPNGTAKLVHYSKEKDLAVIDPKYHGTGQIGAERLRQMNEGKAYIPRSFFYRAGTKIEPRFKGMTKYQVEVPESSLVDLATLKGTPTERERAAKKAGYKGYYNSESSMPNVVAMFESIPTMSGRAAAATVGDLRSDPLFSPRTWVSQIEKVLEQKMPKSASAAQVKGILSPQNGIKQDELQEMGIDEYLASKDKFDKHNILEWVRAHQIQAEQVTFEKRTRELTPREIEGIKQKHARKITYREDNLKEDRKSLEEYERSSEEDPLGTIKSMLERRVAESTLAVVRAKLALEEELKRRSVEEDSTKYASWQLPGGENYKEVFVTLPGVGAPTFVELSNWRAQKMYGEDYNAWEVSADRPNGTVFRSNVDIEEYPTEAEAILVAQSIAKRHESNWGGRWTQRPNETESDRAGYVVHDVMDPTGRVRATLPSDEAAEYMIREQTRASQQWRDGHESYDDVVNPIVRLRMNDRTTVDGKKLLFLEEVQPPNPSNQEKMPKWALKRWREIGLKQALRIAADGGYDAIGWTTGAQQADRYSLRKHVDRLTILLGDKNENGESTYEVRAHTPDQNLVTRVVPESELPGVIGEELASRAIAEVPKSDFAMVTYKDLDLATGGEGLMKVYDQDLVNAANGIAKKWGVQAGSNKLPTDQTYGLYDEKLGRNVETPLTITVHTLPVTDTMKTVAKEGLPLFNPKQTETETFKKWFGKSVVVNPDGSPKEMYHGSIEEFHVFDKEKIRPFDYDAEFNGFWFSDEPSTGPAMRDARYRKSVYLRMENPAPPNVWRPLLKEASQKFEQYKSKGARTEHDTVRMLLQERGYDGVFFANRPTIDENELNLTGVVRFKNARGHEYELRKEDLHNLGSPGYELYDYNPFHPEESSHITGYETLEQFLSQNETVVVVFEPTQIKSSDANSGTFDPNNPDIRFATKPKQPKPAPTFQVEQPGALDKVVRVLQDKAIDIKRIVESVQKAGLTVPDELNPILKEEMYMKRAEQRASDFTNDELRPLVKAMQLSKVTLEQLDHYLQARHIIRDRVNHHLQQINPDLQGTPQYDKLAGMTDAEARAILAKVDPKIMEPLAKRVDKMVEKTRDLMVAYGLEKQSTIDQWRQFYTAYVPLHREGFEEDGHPTGTGRSVRGSTVKGRTGSDLGVTNILANVAQARDQIITRGEKQRPVIAMAGLMMLYPNPEIATLDKPAQIQMTDPATGLITTVPGNLTNYTVPTVRRYDPVDGVVKTYPDPMYKGRDNVVNFRIDGQDYAIVFNERNERAMEAAKAFKELDTAKLNGIMAAIAPYTRYLASINTQYNPIFGIVNFVRDAQFAMLALGSTPLAGKKIDVFKNAVSSLAGIYQDARAVRLGRHPSSATAQMWERFQHVGGPTGYRDLFFSSTDRAAEIERMLKPNDLGLITGPQALGKRLEETWMLQTLSDYNTTMENSLRLGVFMTAVQQGMSDIQAASYAKNITVNFNKKGQIGAQMGSLFAFFNANVQGTARIFETVFERTKDGVALSAAGKKIVVGGLLVGILQTFALAMAGFGDDEPPEYIKARNLVIPIPGTKKGYGLLPMPLGFNLLPNVGRAAAEAIRAGLDGRDIKPMMRLANLVGAFYGTFSPLGGTGGPIQEMLPTVADPIAAVVSNKDWTGKNISKEDQSSLDPTPGHTRTRDTASYWATFLSKAINWATGGTNYTPGALSPTPDMIDYLVEQATGGIGRELSKTSQVIQSLATGEELPFYKVPLAGRFAGSAEGTTAIRSTFYDNVKAVNLAHREFLGRAKDRTGDAHEYLRSHPEGRLYESANSIERTIGELQKVKRDLIKQDAPRATIRMREEQITGLMKRFNDQVEVLKKGSTP